jgi:hypothetical protein
MSIRRLDIVSRSFLLVLSLVCLIGWQHSIFRTDLPDTYSLGASSGLQSQQRFVYFLYYLNLFPVASLKAGRDKDFVFDGSEVREPNTLVYSRDAARRVLTEAGSSLVMEWGHTMRTGSYLLTYLHLPDAWRLGSPERAELRIATSLAFVLGLAALLVSAWVAGSPVLGFALVGFLGSNPFQLYEAYRRENVFGWPIAAFCLALAIMWPVLAGKARGWYSWGAAVAASVLLGTVYHIRVECASTELGVLAAFLMAPGLRWPRRAALTAAATLTFVITIAGWTSYFDHKWAEATAVVREAGGHPYTWQRTARHQLWGSVFSGLGDFDTKYGYSWRDQTTIPYLQGVLKQKYGEDIPWWFGSNGRRARTSEDYFDAARLYYRHPLQTPHLLEVARDKVLHDVARDPWWYLTILGKRIWRVLGETTPLQLYLTSHAQLPIPFSGYLVIPIVLLAVAFRDWFAIRLLIFSLPLSLTAVAIYSGGQTPYYSVYHIVAAAIVIAWIADRAARMYARPGRRFAAIGRVTP